MENIESRAKNQLLNLQEDYDQLQYESFLLNPPSMREKPKPRGLARVFTSLSSHNQISNFQKQNNKEILKYKLKKLLEKDLDVPEIELKRIKTISSLQTAKNSDSASNLFKVYGNKDGSKLKALETIAISSLRKSNISGSKKAPNPKEIKQSRQNAISIFEKENEQIRKFIKRKMEEKAIEKKRKLVLSKETAITKEECLQKINTFNQQKTKFLQNAKQNAITKQKVQNQQGFSKISHRENIVSRKAKNKQNHYDVTALSTPLIKLNKQNNYEARKLRSILF